LKEVRKEVLFTEFLLLIDRKIFNWLFLSDLELGEDRKMALAFQWMFMK